MMLVLWAVDLVMRITRMEGKCYISNIEKVLTLDQFMK